MAELVLLFKGDGMDQAIVGYHKDKDNDWVAELQCGHFQHVRHDPPLISRVWVLSEAGRHSRLGHELTCKKCELGLPKDTLS